MVNLVEILCVEFVLCVDVWLVLFGFVVMWLIEKNCFKMFVIIIFE